MRLLRCVIGGLVIAVGTVFSISASEPDTQPSFERRQLSEQFFCEGATCADINRDGQPDVVAGPYWYAGPDFQDRSEIYPPKPFDINGYSENFFAFAYDLNADDWTDILVVGFPGKQAFWFENPGGTTNHWQRHLAFSVVDNESPTFVDLTGDGRPELVFHTAGRIGYAEIPPQDATQRWQFHPVTPDLKYDRFNHGLGVGDVNGDGRQDFLERNGWWEQPATPADDGLWTFHAVQFADAGGAQMFAYDLDGDGDNDIITSKNAHGYGLSWFENVRIGKANTFREHVIMSESPAPGDGGISFSQLHALALADIDGDGLRDIVTGKRFWAHGEHDPGSRDPAVLYWFKTVRDGSTVRFFPNLVDDNSGVGTQVVVGDLNGDNHPDIVVGDKKGTFAFLQKKAATAEHTVKPAQFVASTQPTAPSQPVGSADKSEPADGFVAKAADGQSLNLDLEKGDLSDWTASGNAFDGQPISGDTVTARRGDMTSGLAGKFWIGTYEVGQDGPQGTLTSVAFPVTHPYATFLIGGGSHKGTRVEIVRKVTNEVVFQAHGVDAEEMHPVTIDLRPHLGKEVFVRIVDTVSYGWGHINYDHFRFYDAEPTVRAVKAVALKADEYPYANVPAEKAVQLMKMPDGFTASVFAAEPDVKQPVAMALDDRGRVWIAEAYEYPRRAPEGQGRDRVLIFEDSNGEGRFDKRTVFAEGLNLVSGLEVGFGGVWVGAAPYLLFIPDRNRDDVPDGKPEILLDGWGYEDTHETLNSFIWGPDGWLYGCHGVFTHSLVGKPGTPARERTRINAGYWRYHPTRQMFEVFAEGTSNSWGVDFNDWGQAISTACVIPHLWHIIQGARYQRQAGEHPIPNTYEDIKTIGDHLHFLGSSPHSGNDRSDSAGGGHAHCGAMIYLGNAWPDQYRNQIFMNNIHGQRLNMDILKRSGSGYVGSHGPDFLLTQDRASQMLNFRYGPDGQVYVIDWYDMQACHDQNPSVHDRSNGRIYRIKYRDTEPVAVDLAKLSDVELAEQMLQKNDWYVRHSRRILEERTAAGQLDEAARTRLTEIATTSADETRRLRAMWALHVTGGLPANLVAKQLADGNEYVRAWTIQLALDREQPVIAEMLPQLVEMAKSDPSPVVRLYIASALQRIPNNDRWDALAALVGHAEDADDHNLPLMYWYAAEPLAAENPQRALPLALSCGKTILSVRDFMLRRIAGVSSGSGLVALIESLRESKVASEQLAIIKSARKALEGRRSVKAPANWAAAYEQLAQSHDEQLRNQATALGVTFGDPAAFVALRKVAADESADTASRREAIQSLLAAKDNELAPILQTLLANPALRDLPLSGLALFDDPQTPTLVLSVYPKLSPAEKRTALATLCARSSYGVAMLRALAEKQIPTADLSADLVRQLTNLKNDEVDSLLGEVWGQVRTSAADKVALIATYKKMLSVTPVVPPDQSLGRAVYGRTCQQCHTLYGAGNNIGPDLTGSNRANLEYLLTNIVDPSALIAKEYQPTLFTLDDGRVITGIVAAEDDKTVTIRTASEKLVVPKEEIEERSLSSTSMMPDDQLKLFTPQEVASLFAYLMGKSQVPMRATKENAALLFNGRDLAGWTGDMQLWSVENGEIVGRSPGIEHNSFLLSDLAAQDFRLSLEVKLVNDRGNTGIQFRTESLDGFEEVRGLQADAGPGWWGKLYEENGRQLLSEKSGEQFLHKGDWNKYEILAVGGHIQTWINGKQCVDLDDPAGKPSGVFGLQIHSGEAMEVRFRNLQLEVIDRETPPAADALH